MDTERQLAHENRNDHWGSVLAERWLALQTLDTEQAPLARRLIEQLCLDIDQGHTCLPRTLEQQALPPCFGSASLQQPQPIVQHEQALYLWRHWAQEHQLALNLHRLLGAALPAVQVADQGGLNALQQQALQQATRHPLTLITGGPGTGKTHTLARVVTALLEQQPELRIALAAPTGKAAQRMEQAMGRALSGLPETVRMPKAQTIHRLLGMDERGRTPYGPQMRLPCDLVVIDEASMLDLQLAHQLFDALATGTRVILLGDAHQLAAVDAGAVLHDLGKVKALEPYRAALRDSQRFDPQKGIGRLARLVLQASGERLDLELDALLEHEAALSDPQVLQRALVGPPEAILRALWSGYLGYAEQVRQLLAEPVAAGELAPIMNTLLEQLDHYRILVAQHTGSYGTRQLNDSMTQFLLQHVGPQAGQQGMANRIRADAQGWYAGRPVMITRNDYGLGLSNGDVGICWPDEQGEWRVHFGHLEESVSVQRLPASQVETAFVLTIHKSQGSEFDRVAMVLDPKGATQLLTRELVYTALTRARHRVELWSSRQQLCAAIIRPTRRTTGLAVQIEAALQHTAVTQPTGSAE